MESLNITQGFVAKVILHMGRSLGEILLVSAHPGKEEKAIQTTISECLVSHTKVGNHAGPSGSGLRVISKNIFCCMVELGTFQS